MRLSRILGILLSIGAAGAAHAQTWVRSDVTPAGVYSAALFGVHQHQQVGAVKAMKFGANRAYIRDHLSGEWTDVHPDGYYSSILYATSGVEQVGIAQPTLQSQSQAGLWKGNAGSFVSLHPSGATRSLARGTSGGIQVGSSEVNGVMQASLWKGSASSWVSLHPDGASESVAHAVAGDLIVGRAVFGGQYRAIAWNAQTLEWTSLHPPTFPFSRAQATNGVQIGGSGGIGGSSALLWPYVGGSHIEFGPLWTQILGMSENYQVGLAGIEADQAVVWRGSAASMIYLGPYRAHDVFENDTYTVIVGSGVWYDPRALVWTITEPSSILALAAGLAFAAARPRKRKGA